MAKVWVLDTSTKGTGATVVPLDGTPEKLSQNEDVKEFYLGGGTGAERRSFKNLKSYRRRKRWIS